MGNSFVMIKRIATAQIDGRIWDQILLMLEWQAVLAIGIDVPRGVICCVVVKGSRIRGWILKVGDRC